MSQEKSGAVISERALLAIKSAKPVKIEIEIHGADALLFQCMMIVHNQRNAGDLASTAINHWLHSEQASEAFDEILNVR